MPMKTLTNGKATGAELLVALVRKASALRHQDAILLNEQIELEWGGARPSPSVISFLED